MCYDPDAHQINRRAEEENQNETVATPRTVEPAREEEPVAA